MEGVHRVHGVVGGDPGRAEAEVEEQDDEEEPGGVDGTRGVLNHEHQHRKYSAFKQQAMAPPARQMERRKIGSPV